MSFELKEKAFVTLNLFGDMSYARWYLDCWRDSGKEY